VDANRYPHRAGRVLNEEIGALYGARAENVALGCGSGEILRMSVDAFTSSTRGLVAGLPTFESPAGRARQLGRPLSEVPVDSKLQLDLGGMLARAKEAGLIFVCNPNNPTGGLHNAKTITAFIDDVMKASPDAVILVDEAYHDYVEDPAYATTAPIALDNPRVIVARTFSKAYGLAGVRLGYAVGQPATIRRLSEWALGNSVSMLAFHAGRGSLAARGGLGAERARNTEVRRFTVKTFTDLGFTVAPSEANFIFVDVRRNAREFQSACRAKGIAVGRPFPPLDNWARVSVGTMDEMKKAASVFKDVLAPTATAAR
jgi:histidinol-phosphate aminotransferase